MSSKLTSVAIQFLCLLWACDSGRFTIHPDQIPTKLAFTVEPTTAIEDAAMSLVAVTVQDVYGNTVSSARTNVTLAIGTNPAGATLSGTTAVAAVSGVAVFSNLILDKAGTGYTLTANASGLTGSTTNPFDVGSIPRKLAFVVQPSATPSGAIEPPVQVAVQDENGNIMASASTNVTVAIGTNPSGGTLSGTTTVSAVRGVAVFSNLILDKRGMGYTLTAGATGLIGATSSPFDVGSTITQLIPSCAPVGAQSFFLDVIGSDFVGGSVVRWNGSDRPTTFISGRELTAQIAASDIAATGTASVTVFNPPPGGGNSNTLTFALQAGGLGGPASITLDPTGKFVYVANGVAPTHFRVTCPCTGLMALLEP